MTKGPWCVKRCTGKQVANLETACDRYKLQEEEWKARLTQAENQARVIHIMSEQVIVA